MREKFCVGRKKPGRCAGTRKSTGRTWCAVERSGAHDPSVRKRPPGSKRLDHSAMHIHHSIQNSREKLFFVQYGRLFFFCQESLESFSGLLRRRPTRTPELGHDGTWCTTFKGKNTHPGPFCRMGRLQLRRSRHCSQKYAVGKLRHERESNSLETCRELQKRATAYHSRKDEISVERPKTREADHLSLFFLWEKKRPGRTTHCRTRRGVYLQPLHPSLSADTPRGARRSRTRNRRRDVFIAPLWFLWDRLPSHLPLLFQLWTEVDTGSRTRYIMATCATLSASSHHRCHGKP